MEIKPLGLRLDPIAPEDFLGGTSQSLEAKYGAEVLNPEGDWTRFVPSTENQDTSTGDTYACVSFATSNAVEMLAKARFGQSKNLSDRFLAKTSGTKVGQGNSPKAVADQLRHGWTVDEPEWPDADTVEEFYADIPQKLTTLAVARGAEFEFGYQYIANTPAYIKEALKRSPVCIAVTAWGLQNQDGAYMRIPGATENHWTTIFKVLPNGNYLVFDSSAPFFKEVCPDACRSVAMSYYLNRNVVKPNKFQQFIKMVLAFLRRVEEPAPTVPVTIPPAPEQQKDPPDVLIPALIQVESGGNDSAVGDHTLVHKAYGCLQIRQPVCDDVAAIVGKHKAEEMLGDRPLSIKVCKAYLNLWVTKAKLGREPTNEDRARVWNGGPSAWKSGTKMNTATNGYWAKVMKQLSA